MKVVMAMMYIQLLCIIMFFLTLLHEKEAEVVIGIKNCSPETQNKVSEILVSKFTSKLNRHEKLSELPEDTRQSLDGVFSEIAEELLQSGKELVDVCHGCVVLKIRCSSYGRLKELCNQAMDGSLTKMVGALQIALRQQYPDIQLTVFITKNEWYRCVNKLDPHVSDDYDPLRRGVDEECPEHKGKRLKFYCKIHDTLCCGLCVCSSSHSPIELPLTRGNMNRDQGLRDSNSSRWDWPDGDPSLRDDNASRWDRDPSLSDDTTPRRDLDTRFRDDTAPRNRSNQRIAQTETRRIILVGKSGNGKSSTGNSMLGEDVFKSDKCFESVTQRCQPVSKFLSNVNREYTLVDTPGLFDTQVPFAKRALEIQEALETCPDPHAFLIVLRPDQRFTEEEQLVIDMLRIIFGQVFLTYAVLVFTRGSDFHSDQELNDFIARCAAINDLKSKCGNRVVRVENNPLIDRIFRKDLLNKICDCVEKVSDGGKKVYSTKSLVINRKCLEEHLKNRKPEATLREDIESLVFDIGSQLEKATLEAMEANKRAEKIVKEWEEAKKRTVQFEKDAEKARQDAYKRHEEARELKMRADKLEEKAEKETGEAREAAKQEAARVIREAEEKRERANKRKEDAKKEKAKAERKKEKAKNENMRAAQLDRDAVAAKERADKLDIVEGDSFPKYIMGKVVSGALYVLGKVFG